MDWQLVGVGLCLLAAAAYVGRSAWRTWTGPAGCGSGCGRCAIPTPVDERRISLL